MHNCLIVIALSLFAGPHDPDGIHGHHHGERPATTPTLDTAVRLGAGPLEYESVAGWCKLPDETPLGNTHGAIVIDDEGLVYFNTDTARSVMVYEPDGTFVRAFGDEYPAIHGMVLNEEDGTPYIYAAHLGGRRLLKTKLDGTVVWSIGVPEASGKYEGDPGSYRPTAIAVTADGTVYAADGYGRNWIHVFDAEQNYVKSFGGPGEEPGKFKTCHGMAIDTRGEKPLLVVCDRENRRLQRFDLDGTFVDVAATDLRRPCALSFWKEYTAVAELEGRVTILDGDFEVVTHLGDNPNREQWARNGVPKDDWVEGIFTAPHGCCFDADGNLYVMDWNATGRISKLRRLTEPATDASSGR